MQLPGLVVDGSLAFHPERVRRDRHAEMVWRDKGASAAKVRDHLAVEISRAGSDLNDSLGQMRHQRLEGRDPAFAVERAPDARRERFPLCAGKGDVGLAVNHVPQGEEAGQLESAPPRETRGTGRHLQGLGRGKAPVAAIRVCRVLRCKLRGRIARCRAGRLPRPDLEEARAGPTVEDGVREGDEKKAAIGKPGKPCAEQRPPEWLRDMSRNQGQRHAVPPPCAA